MRELKDEVFTIDVIPIDCVCVGGGGVYVHICFSLENKQRYIRNNSDI